MQTAIWISIFISLFASFAIILLSRQSKAEKEQAKARRLAEAKMNARLLKLNL